MLLKWFFLKKYNVQFERDYERYRLAATKRGSSGLGSSSVIKKVKFEEEIEIEKEKN